jgi:molybdopterin molybdotransferase
MVPLSDDCFAHGGALMTVDEALEQIERQLEPVVEAENVPLLAAAGRVLAQDLVAGMDLPPHANSAVDGYAVAHSDLFPDRETVSSVGGRTAAGHHSADRSAAARQSASLLALLFPRAPIR